MKHYRYVWFVSSIFLYFAIPTLTQAQPIPDATLTPNNTDVDPQGNEYEITGGVEAGNNLFHSFREFSVPNGAIAYFNNLASIQNIISRVTGRSPSQIDGIIRANGAANLFLINPNGIIFGADAQLNIGGSFLASTATSFVFDNGTFSVIDPQSPPLLTLKAPIGLQYGANAGSIVNQSTVGLEVLPGRTLSLVGGNVRLSDGGTLTAPGGRIELGGLAEAGTVELRVEGNELSFSFPKNVAITDISLINGAQVNVQASGGGSITVNAKNLEIFGSSQLLAGIGKNQGSVGTQAGNITINSAGAVSVADSKISNLVESGATGNGGNITLKADSLSMNNSLLQAVTIGTGNAGSVTIESKGEVSLSGSTAIRSNVSGPITFDTREKNRAVGSSGGLNIQARSLNVLDGAQLQVEVRHGGKGDAGDIQINVDDTVTIAREDKNEFPSAISSFVEKNANGDGGKIFLTTGSLNMSDGGQIKADTLGVGNAGSIEVIARDSVSLSRSKPINPTSISSDVGGVGNGGTIDIKTRSLSLTGGGQIGATVLRAQAEENLPAGRGEGGNIQIQAADSILISGFDEQGYSSGLLTSTEEGAKGQAGNITVNTNRFRIADGASVDARTDNSDRGGDILINATTFEAVGGGQIQSNTRSSGKAGNLTVTAERMIISGSDPTYSDRLSQFGSQVVTNAGPESGLIASSSGSGEAGRLTVIARSLLLDRQGKLAAQTESSDGGEIDLQNLDSLVLLGNSTITARAGERGNGGNIDIETENLAVLENSQIRATAQQGRGGEIDIRTQGLFAPAGAISASSEVGIDGEVSINRPDIDPSKGVVALPDEVVAVEDLVVQGCGAPGRAVSKFIVTGRGGMPPSPSDVVTNNTVLVDLGMPSSGQITNYDQERITVKRPAIAKANSFSSEIVEAQGWITESSGKVVLTAQAPSVNPYRSGINPADCRDSKHSNASTFLWATYPDRARQ